MSILTDEQRKALSQPLDPQLIKQRDDYQGGRKIKLSYIEGHTVKRHANEIFGFDGWDYQLDRVQEVYCGDHLDRKTKEVKGRKVVYTAQVRVKVGDLVREDVGYGSGYGQDDGDATEGAIKEAVTDALKRALVSFGDQFGLGLYGGSPSQVQRQQAAPPQPQNGKDKAAEIDPKRELTGDQRVRFAKVVQDAYDDLGDMVVNEVLAKHNVKTASAVVYAKTAAAIGRELKKLRAGLMAGAPLN